VVRDWRVLSLFNTEHDVSGIVLLDLNEEMLAEMNVEETDAQRILEV
jgi:hypothetical protein